MAQACSIAFAATLPGRAQAAQGFGLAPVQELQPRLRAQGLQPQCGAVCTLHRLAQALSLQALQARI
jgi:hypothetical protein